ncbi:MULTISPECIES: apolipoprotein N-acyltransferase [unclassified Pseudomonas]|uniref:apolipoprotein N-acyltransferase n=1 Tax=unclassified Pseudomonas TaxID=196821 RepID=UPI002AC9D03D|nr:MULTISPECIES: apolipoprotein N-acyltransferase [unclassified Pseudomonas]MEB0043189.1 apolipoprotein N-acyltransferase [Pseudomonas sp. MH10]MEB0076692.1 apolipoprotein N-acyltransferase [Pseudomonas sp. MH10out]MEB0090377.1 apolipoprotein N-acyltransferase [Pseudomonas sp. CCI4.2]MEB0103591.1 apolipoprotein N-acyltransferase [Pseudomonas sp. CCI3.2]MEB0120780.1 apolipoprotein N-acyltransferase [Pseudomonas sp. CCI1.2]
MHWITRPGWPGNLLAMVAGALTTLALAPFDVWPLAIVSLVVLYLGLRELSPRQALGRGWCYGFGLFGAGTSWIYVSIHTYGGASVLLAGLLMLGFIAAIAWFFALPTWIWARWIRRNNAPLTDALAFAGVWLAQEAFRGWFLTGFPWLYSGYSQLDGPLSGLAPIGGMWLISFTLALTAALLCNLPQLRANKSALSIGVLLLVAPWVLSLSLKTYEWTSPAGPPLSVAAIQGNVEQSMKWDPAQLNAQLALYRDMTFTSKRADLIVWPETAIPILKESAEGYLTMLGKFAADRNSALITGVPIRQQGGRGEYRYYNGITVVGEGDGTYLKQKLVPFGEYVPLQDLLRGLISFFNLPMSDFARGPSDQALLQAKGYQIAPFICYEVVYPEFAAGLAARSELLLTVSNDTWFGTSIGPLQHLQMAKMRALEAGRWMIRATNNGVSGLINPFGKMVVTIPQFQKGVLYGDVVPMQDLTPYLRWRSWPLTILSIVLVGWALVARRMKR